MIVWVGAFAIYRDFVEKEYHYIMVNCGTSYSARRINPGASAVFCYVEKLELFGCHQIYCQKHFVSPKTIGTMIDVLPERIEEFQMSSTRSQSLTWFTGK